MNGSSMINGAMTDGNDLVIEFKGGKMYRYEGAAHLEQVLSSAPSAGRFFHANIRGSFVASAV